MYLPVASPIIILSPDPKEAHDVAAWLRGAGISGIATARTCDEAIFMLGRNHPCLLIMDERIPDHAERRLLSHIATGGDGEPPPLLRLVSGQGMKNGASGWPGPIALIRRPLRAHDVVSRVGVVLDRPDLLGRLDQAADQSARHLEAARQMQIALLPTPDRLERIQSECGVGVASLYRSGEAIGGDLWGIWPTGRGRFALGIADFVGHGVGAALNTFRLHTLLSDELLPRGRPTHMMTVLNQRLHALLARGHYATMIYLHIDPQRRRIAWCSAGAPPPLFVASDHAFDLVARGVPLGVRAGSTYKRQWMRLPDSGILAVFSDGLFESGPRTPEVPRTEMAAALAEPAAIASEGDLATAAKEGILRLQALRDQYPCTGHSDDVVAICVAFGPSASDEAPRLNVSLAISR